jgi:glycosyltransferase involved in cell wall biosynthesis
MISLLNRDKKLRILQVLPSLVSGGVERGTVDLCKYLVEQGHQAWVVSSGGPLVKVLEEIGAKHIKLGVQSKNPFFIWKNSRVLRQLIQKHQFDLIHARSRAPAWSCYWASKQSKIPFVATFHGQYGHQNSLKRFYNSIMLKGDVCIAVSQFIETHIKSVYPEHHTNIKLIPRGIDLALFSPSYSSKKNAEALRKKWHIGEQDKVIILPGRLTRLKGHQTFLEAISQLKELNSVHCLIVGDEPGKDHYQQELQAFIEQQNLIGKVQFTGNYYDMPAIYQLADIVISASIKPESFGRTACEAQAMGCLVVATKHGGSLETISPMQRQFMCEVNDNSSMASSIKKALSYCDEKKLPERSKIDISSRAYIEENFSLNKMCGDTITLYQELTLKDGHL